MAIAIADAFSLIPNHIRYEDFARFRFDDFANILSKPIKKTLFRAYATIIEALSYHLSEWPNDFCGFSDRHEVVGDRGERAQPTTVQLERRRV